jgi:hypothetical protein
MLSALRHSERKRLKPWIWMLLAASTPALADPGSARAAFDDIRAKMDAYDPGVAQYYAADAKITTLRNGSEQIEISGEQYAQLIAGAMPFAKARGDRSTYSDVRIQAIDGGFRISAKRYSELRCYTDAGYRMDLQLRDGAWKIVAEHMETRSTSACAPGQALDDALAATAKAIATQLPIEIDADTRLHSVHVDGRVLIHRFLLHTIGRDGVEPGAFAEAMRNNLKTTICADPATLQLLRGGATMRYLYQTRDGAEAASIDLVAADCAG